MARWRKYRELSGKGLRCVEIGSKGNLWFGTVEGVFKYDGMEWLEYPMPEDLPGVGIAPLCFSTDGELYVGSSRALVVLKMAMGSSLSSKKRRCDRIHVQLSGP